MEDSGAVIKRVSGPILLALIAETILDDEFAAKFWKIFQSRRRAVINNILSRGIERGELPLGLDIEFWTDLFFGGPIYRLVTRPAPIDRSFGGKPAKLLPDACSDGHDI